MHNAFEADPILDKLPLGIESIACYGKFNTMLEQQLHIQQHFC